MLQFRGGPALSAFRIRILLEKLQLLLPEITSLDTRFLYFVDSDGAPGAAERALLERLLNDGEAPSAPTGALMLVVPRIGTVSPWASKATDIARNCGLKKVRRIERGVVYYLNAASGLPGRAALERLAPALHDRMTQTVLYGLEEAARLFAQAAPAPLNTVDVLGGGREALLKADLEYGFALS